MFEPCGLNQMYSLRYGTVPVVHAVGGLDDTVQPYTSRARHANGFKFREPTADALVRTVVRRSACTTTRPHGCARCARDGGRSLLGDVGAGICQSVQTGSTRCGRRAALVAPAGHN